MVRSNHKEQQGGGNHLGLVGQHIAYSLSPLIHSTAAELLGRSCRYELYDLAAADLASFLQDFWQQGGVGLNVTTPHKRAVATLLGMAGASVNTLYRGPQGWQACSTDGEGFARAVGRLGRPLWGFAGIVLLGAGGAAAGIVDYLAQTLPAAARPQLTILRRRSHEDAGLQLLAQNRFSLSFAPFTPEALQGALARAPLPLLLVQATSAPQQGESLAEFCPALQQLQGKHLQATFCDLVYARPSALLAAARALHLPSQDGLGMLIEQGRLAEERWWGEAPTYAALLSKLVAQGVGVT